MGGAAMSRTEALPTMPVLMPAASIPLTEPGSSHPAPVLIMVPHVRPNPSRHLSLVGLHANVAAAESQYDAQDAACAGKSAWRAMHSWPVSFPAGLEPLDRRQFDPALRVSSALATDAAVRA